MQDEQIRILCQHAVKYAPNGISAEAVADALGMRYATLMSQLSAQPGHKLGAEIVLPIMQLTGAQSLRDVLAFPKAANASCLMMETPSTVDPEQLKMCGIAVGSAAAGLLKEP